jgi:hypothetical protein
MHPILATVAVKTIYLLKTGSYHDWHASSISPVNIRKRQ